MTHAILRRVWADLNADLDKQGLHLETWPGFDIWQYHMKLVGSDVNPSFRDGTGSTLALYDAEGSFVAMLAIRLYANISRVEDLIQSGRVWSTPEQAIMAGDVDYVDADLDGVSGNLVQTGGLYVMPGHRGEKLGVLLYRLACIAAIRGFEKLTTMHCGVHSRFNFSASNIAFPIISGICGTTVFPRDLSLSTLLGTP